MHDDQFRILLEYQQYSWPGYRKVPKGVKKRIQCNNVLTYYRRQAREKALTGMLESLLPGGY
ncbi:MAG: hypothetical protein QNL14_08720 [Deltaproteobacteria bacterium]|nr:hypothetical protein [Deltaproteobacteria bacterium]